MRLLPLLLLAPISQAQVLPITAQKIDDDEGGFGGALDSGDRFGRSIVGIGDLDGDGVPDAVVGARSDDDGGVDAGAVYVLFLEVDGTVASEQKISATSGGLAAGSLDAGDFFGYTVAPLGDLDGDGTLDIAVGAPNDDDGAGSNAGAVYVLFLEPDGTVRDQQKISLGSGGLGPVIQAGDAFGMGMGALGDLDGDGVVDLGVASPNDDNGGNNRGAVHLVFLNVDGTVKTTGEISQGMGGFGGVLSDGDSFGGRTVTRLGDLDGDGNPELGVGAFRDDDGGTDRGAFWVLFLDASLTVSAWQKVSQVAGGFSGALADEDLFGMTLAPLGDVDLDGVPDLIVGSNRDDDGTGNDKGACFLLCMNADGTVKDAQKISEVENPFADLYFVAGERFGRALGVIGDLAGDGALTVGVGAGAGVGGGAVWLLTFERPVGERYCAANPNSSGQAAWITATGRSTADQGPLRLRAHDLPPGEFGYFFASEVEDFVPLFAGSMGNLCVGQPLVRYATEVGAASPAGTRLVDVDPTAPPDGTAFSAGETWHFQYWTRDHFPGPTSNTTDAVRVTLQ